MWIILLSAVFTILAGVLTALLFARNKSVPGRTDASPAPCTEQGEEARSGLGEPQAECERTAQTTKELPDEQCGANRQEIAGDRCEQGESEDDGDSSHSPSDQALKYMPGMLRTSQIEKMMSKEELEEEQRVQQEQLAAIFRLLQENQDTFGEVTEKDMEEQLKLYSI